MNYISSIDHDGFECVLVSTDNNCPIELGDIVKDVLGNNVIVKGGHASRWPDSSGSVHFSYEYSPIRETTHPFNISARWQRIEAA